MKYQRIRDVSPEVSRIVFGCAIPQMIRGEDTDALLDEMYAAGITAYDTAENYGLSEVSLGHWIKNRNNREKIVIITKGCHPYDGRDRVTSEDLKHDIEQSFERLGTDYIDIYMLHRDDLKTGVGPVVEVLNEYHRAGRIGAFGASNWIHQRIEAANQYAAQKGLTPFTVASPNFGLCEQVGDPWGGGSGCVTISGPENKKARQWYAEQGIPVFAYSSLGRGMLSGKVKSSDIQGAKKILDENAQKGYCYPENFERLRRVEIMAEKKHASVSQIALAWIMNQDFLVFPIVSTADSGHIEENVKALDIHMTPEEVRWLDLR